MKKYAAFIERRQVIPGDERSRTHPGHGYPEHTVTSVEVTEFESFEGMQKWVERQERTSAKQSYRLVEYEELKVKHSLEIVKKED